MSLHLRCHRPEPRPERNSPSPYERQGQRNPAACRWVLVAEEPTDNPLLMPGHRLVVHGSEVRSYLDYMAGRREFNAKGGRLFREVYQGCTFRHAVTGEEVTVR